MKKLYILTCFLLCMGMGTTKAQIINTIAGNGTIGYSGNGGPATSAQLYYPTSVMVDPLGNVYIADYYNNCIRKVNTSGIISTFAGNNTQGFSGDGGPATSAQLNWPYGVNMDASGTIYISEQGNNRVRTVNASGIISTFAGNGIGGYSGDGGQATNAKLFYPRGSVTDASGNVYIADFNNSCIRKVNASGIISTFAGTGGVFSYSGDGGPATAAELHEPNGVALDASGNLYVSDLNNYRIRKVNTSGIISTFAGNGFAGYSGDGGPATAAEIFCPAGITFDAAGNLYFDDVDNGCVRKINTSGIISTVAGRSGHYGYTGDGGPATLASFAEPSGVAVDALGNIYIADYFNNAIREVFTTLGINELRNSGLELVVYPNPSNGQFQLGINNYELGIQGTLEVYNMLGEKVYSSTLSVQHSAFGIDLSNNANGIYLYRVIANGGELVGEGKLVIEK